MSRTFKATLVAIAAILAGATAFFAYAPASIEKSMNVIVAHAPYVVSRQAADLHEDLFIADMHADTFLWDRPVSDAADRGHVDLPRLRQGNVALQVFTAVTKTPRGQNYESNSADTDNITALAIAQLWPMRTWDSLLERALYQARRMQAMVARHDDVRLILSSRDLAGLMAARASGDDAIGIVIGAEGAHPIEGDVANLERLYDAGFRVIGLVHFFDNEIGGSAHGIDKGGLTPLGESVLRWAENRGMLIDLAHASPALIDNVLALAERPVVVSHTGVKATCDGPRNLSDDQIRRIAAAGGVIGIGFWDGAVCEPSLQGIVAAIAHTAAVAGIDHVALGSDWDGATAVPIDASELSALTQALLDAGFAGEDIAKIMGGNVARLFSTVLP